MNRSLIVFSSVTLRVIRFSALISILNYLGIYLSYLQSDLRCPEYVGQCSESFEKKGGNHLMSYMQNEIKSFLHLKGTSVFS